MLLRMLQCCVLTAMALAIAPLTAAMAQTEESKDPLQSLATELAEGVGSLSKERPTVAVLDFTDIRNRANELGRYMALRLANELVSVRAIAVLDRANLETIMAEHQLTAEGLLRPEDAKKLGQFAGVDALIIGNLTPMSDNIELLVRAISTDSSEILASGKAAIPATDELRKMAGMQVDSPRSSTTGSSGVGGVSAISQADAITVKEIGPVEFTLRSVMRYSVKIDRETLPGIRCSFDVSNRRLDRSIAIGGNLRVLNDQRGRVTTRGSLGELVGSGGLRWPAHEVRGLAAVFCFEYTGASFGHITQTNPSAVVDYIQTGKRYEGGRPEDAGLYWSGQLSSIPPGETTRVTIDFVPDMETVERDAEIAYPDYFQLNLDLVIGTHDEGEKATDAQDLMLRSLTIDRVNFPRDAETVPE